MPFPSFSTNTSSSTQRSSTHSSGQRSRSESSSSLSDDGSHTGEHQHQHQHEHGHHQGRKLDPPILVYHESARSIVFRDHLRRAVVHKGNSDLSTHSDHEQTTTGAAAAEALLNQQDFLAPLPHKALVVVKDDKKSIEPLETLGTIATELFDRNDTVLPSEAGIPAHQIGGFQPQIQPLPSLDFGPDDHFEPLLQSATVDAAIGGGVDELWTDAEAEVVELFRQQRCAVKMVKNTDWGDFLHRFCYPQKSRGRAPSEHDDIGPDADHPFNSFVTSTTLLPSGGKKMRCYGSPIQYTVGVVFALPDSFDNGETEDQAAARTQTWSWPAGYSAKTEFNIDGRGRLINGRQEALVPFSVLRSYNDDYLTKESYMIGARYVENAGLSQIPYNEVYLRVGGLGRLVKGVDCTTLHTTTTTTTTNGDSPKKLLKRSFDRGVGLPVALFVRSATYGNLVALLRTRARLMHSLGEQHIKGMPLLLVTPENGVQVLTKSLQHELWKIAARNLNPFQNSSIAYKTTMNHTDEVSFQQKVEELLDLDESIQKLLTPEELARIAGGFGATDDSVANILKRVLLHDRRVNKELKDSDPNQKSCKLQDVVNEGLASALRSGDYHTSRQLLILYSLVATSVPDEDDDDDGDIDTDNSNTDGDRTEEEIAEQQLKEQHDSERKEARVLRKQKSLGGGQVEFMNMDLKMVKRAASEGELSAAIPGPPPPPPLDTDRLRSATNSDGLLAVLGAAQVLRVMQDGTAKKRVQEAVDAVEEWVNYGEQSVAFRISSWYDQRAAQDDLKIATEQNSNFMAFVSNKAIANRRAFATQLREAISSTDFSDIRFLQAINAILQRMHSPCLRLELLQYVLGLDNRYSIAHVARSVELAATCLNISATSFIR